MLAVIQFDAVSLPLLEQLTAAGRMPVFQDLRSRGRWHVLETPAAHLPAAAYPSMYSGYDVGEHGLHYSYQWSPAHQAIRFRRDFAKPPAVWDRLARAGKRSLVIDPYESTPPDQVAGCVVSGWQYADIASLERWSAPRGWTKGSERRLGRAPFMQEVFGSQSARSLLSRRRIFMGAARRVADLAAEMLGRERFDLFWAALLGSHEAGHALWDVSHLEVDDDTGARLGSTLARTYEEADRALGRICEALPDDADLLIVSPLGMGPDTSRVDLLGGMLERVLGTASTEAGSRIWRVRAAVPTPIRAAVARAAGARFSRSLTARLSVSGIDWRETRAFLLPGDATGHIRFNVRGREREGILDPAQMDPLAEQISDGLTSFRDLGGGPSIASVDRAADVFPGPRSGLLPDLIVQWANAPGYTIEGVHSDRYGEVLRLGAGKGRSGGHTPDAWALLVLGASAARTPTRPPRVTDIAATAFAYFGIEGPDGLAEPLLQPA